MSELEELDAIIAAYQASHLEEDGKRVAERFKHMAHTIFDVMKLPPTILGAPTEEEAVRFVVFVAFSRLHLYDPAKGKAFNYFTTVMLNYWRKEHKRWKKREKLEGMYGRYL